MALQHKFEAPGAMNYIKAIYDLTQGMQKSHTGEARIGFLTSALVNVVMAAETYEILYQSDRLSEELKTEMHFVQYIGSKMCAQPWYPSASFFPETI